MFQSVALPILLVVANVTGVGMVVPQVLRLRRLQTTAGVSAVGVGVGIAMNLCWVTYATAQQLWGLLPVAVGGALLYTTVAFLLVTIDGRRILAPLGRGHVISVIPLAGFLGWGWAGAGLAIGLLYGAQFAPALVSAVRSTSLEGISTAMWLMAWVEAAIWLVYGFAEWDHALIFGGGGGTVVASLILARLAWVAAQPVPVPVRSLPEPTMSVAR